MEHPYALDAGQLFTLFFIVFGPLKLLGPFMKATQGMAQPAITSLAVKAVVIIAPILVILSFVGRSLLQKWQIPVGILLMTGGLIFAFVAFSMILVHKKEEPSPANPVEPNPLSVALSMILTPYGIAALIVVLAMSRDHERTLMIFAMLFANLILNLLSMIYVRKIMGKAGAISLQILGAVLGVLQASLALQMILIGWQILPQ